MIRENIVDIKSFISRTLKITLVILFAFQFQLRAEMSANKGYYQSAGGDNIKIENVHQLSERIVTGHVRAANGETLPGVSVVVKGTTNGVITDMDGNFSLKVVEPDAALIFSFIGYVTQTIRIDKKNVIEVVLL